MASKYSVELSLDTKGYSDGIQNAENANADFVSSLGNVGKSLPNLRKELGAARRETMGLALAYNKLSAEQKKSGYGQQMAKALEESKRKTAELVDLTGDLQTEIKNMASDTAGWDALKEGIGIARDAATGFIGTIATLSGKEKELQPLIAKIAQIQGVANAAIGIGNALQKQSAVMLGISRIQKAALTKATELEAAATGKATIAQKAFNLVAKANPYVLLATAVLAAGAALGTYMAFANKSEDATAKLNKEMHSLSIQGQKDAQDDITKLDILYRATQNVNLGMDARKKAVKELQDQYPAYFGNMTTEQILLGQASEKYQQLKNDILAVAMAKAYEQKIADIAKENVELDDQLETQRKITKEREAQAKRDREQAGTVPGMTSFGTGAQELGAQASINASKDAEKDLETQIDNNRKAQEKYLEKIDQTTEAQQRLNEAKTKESKTPKSGGDTTDVKAETGSIVALEKEISGLQNKLRNGLIPDNAIQNTVNRIKDLQGQVKELKIKYGFEEPEKAKTKLEQLQKDLADAQKAYIIAVDTNDEQARQAAQEAYYNAQAELDKYTASIKIEAKVSDADKRKIQDEVDKIVNEALNPQSTPTFDFSALKEKLPESLRPAIDTTLEEYNRVYEARQELIAKMNESGASDAAISAAQAGLDKLDEKWQQLIEDVRVYNEANEEVKNANKNTQELASSVQSVGKAAQAAGNLFSALGEASDDNSMKAMGIVAQAIATVALSFAQALTTAKTWVDWLAFGVTGMATMVTMITQIKGLTAGAYADGGIVGGHSYYGDKLFARVNSGEGIFNEKQMKSLNEQLDNKRILAIGGAGQFSVSTIAVEGTELLLTINNTLKEQGRPTI